MGEGTTGFKQFGLKKCNFYSIDRPSNYLQQKLPLSYVEPGTFGAWLTHRLSDRLSYENWANSPQNAVEALNLIECKAQEWIHVVGIFLRQEEIWKRLNWYWPWPVLERCHCFGESNKWLYLEDTQVKSILSRLYLGRLLTLVLLTAVLHYYLWYTNPLADPCNLHKACSPRKPWLSSSQAQEQGTWPHMFHHLGL